MFVTQLCGQIRVFIKRLLGPTLGQVHGRLGKRRQVNISRIVANRWLSLAGIVLLLTASVFSQSEPDNGGPPTGNSTSDNPPSRVARISYLKGKVSLEPSGMNQWSEATLNFTVTTGDRLYTDNDARAELQVGPYTARISENTDLTIANLNDQLMQLGLEQGTVRVSVYTLPSNSSVEIDTPNGAISIEQPGTYRIDSEPDESGTVVTVNSGSVEITGGDLDQHVRGGRAVRLSGNNPIQLTNVSVPGLDSFDRWSEDRDSDFSRSTSARYVSRDVPGYADLDGYGHWVTVDQYGPVWYPAVAADWVPYRVGHWAWVYPWGWTWVEDEPWGFAPFHYGRWVHVGQGWGWIPGAYVVRPVYAPALVAFVGGPNFVVGGIGVAAWFPLGPQEVYRPWYHYRGDYFREVNVTNVRNVTNITNVTNVTNITYVNRNVATTAVRRNSFGDGRPVQQERVAVSNAELSEARVIPHPLVNPSSRAALPGRAVNAPPVRAQRPFTNERLANANRMPAVERNTSATRETTAPPARTSAPGENREPRPLVSRNAPAANGRNGAPPEGRNSSTISDRNANGRGSENRPATTARENSGPSTERPTSRLITRRTPPESRVPFDRQQSAMSSHPGRPLEPEQMQNLRQGRDAGPMRDQENPSHAERMSATRGGDPRGGETRGAEPRGGESRGMENRGSENRGADSRGSENQGTQNNRGSETHDNSHKNQ